jgi:hypothetical protein
MTYLISSTVTQVYKIPGLAFRELKDKNSLSDLLLHPSNSLPFIQKSGKSAP